MRKKSPKKDLMIKRKVRLKKRKKRFILTSIAFLGCAIVITALLYKLYINSKSKDLSYAINYTLTNKSEKNQRLLDIKKVDLVFKDEDRAIVEAFGLSKKKPHNDTKVKGYLKKDSSGIWELEKTDLIAL